MLDKMKATDDQRTRTLKRGNSMGDIGDRYREEDDRRVNTEPLDPKKKKYYENLGASFERPLADNCYAEPAEKKTPTGPPVKKVGKIIQGNDVESVFETEPDD